MKPMIVIVATLTSQYSQCNLFVHKLARKHMAQTVKDDMHAMKWKKNHIEKRVFKQFCIKQEVELGIKEREQKVTAKMRKKTVIAKG